MDGMGGKGPRLLVDIHKSDEAEEDEFWMVSGDLRRPGSGWSDEANYEARDLLRPRFPRVEFDPESACFFAYADDERTALEVAEACQEFVAEREGWPVQKEGEQE